MLAAVAIACTYIGYRYSNSVLVAIGSSVFVILLGVLAVGAINKDATTRLIAMGLPQGPHPVRVAIVAHLSEGPEVVVRVCLSAIRDLPNFGSIKEHDPHGYIAAKTRVSMSSTFGEKITVRAAADGSGTQLSLESKPGSPTVGIDSGFNFQNVALVLRYVHREIGVSSVDPKDPFIDIFRTRSDSPSAR